MNWIWKGRDDVIFETAGDRKRKEKVKNIKRFLLAAAVLTVIAVLLILKQYNFDLSAALGRNDVKEKPTEIVTQTNEKKYSAEKKTFLFYCCDDEKTALDFLILMHVDLSQDVVHIHPVDVNEKLLTYRDFSGEVTGSASGCFKAGGSSMLTEACENYIGRKIDRFLGTTRTDFSNIIVNFPNVKVDLAEDLRLSNGVDSVYFNSGIQEISDVNLLKFLTYGGRGSTEQLLSDQAQAAASAVSCFINETSVENADVVFDRVINLSQSNISVFDLKTHIDSLEYVSKYSSEFAYKTELSKDEFAQGIDQ